MIETEEAKQNYLRENILDKGYDAEDFASFLKSKKGELGVKLGLWTLSELKLAVQEYILKNPMNNKMPGNNNFQNMFQNPLFQNMNIPNMPQGMNFPNMNMLFNNGLPNMPNMPNISNMPNMPNISNMPNMPNISNMPNMPNLNIDPNLINNIQNMNLNNTNPENNMFNAQGEPIDIYGIVQNESLICLISDKNELTKYENIKIEIALGEKKTGSLFTKSYQTYEISVPILNMKVIRRYSDFEWLRQTLVNMFTSSVIPPIPKKNKIGGDRFKEQFLEKRTRTLEKFLNLLLQDPNIKSSKILYDFISIEQDNQFNNAKKSYNNFKPPQQLKDYQTFTGKLDIKVDEGTEIYYQNIKDQTELNQELLSKLNKQLKLLNNEMNSVVTRLSEVAKCCEDLFNHSVKFEQSDEFKISYYQLNEMFKQWSEALKKQNSIMFINIREHFKFSRNIFKSMKDLINSADNYKQMYNKAKKNLINKKEDLFRKGDTSKWELGENKDKINVLEKTIALPNMLPSETNNVNNIKQMYGYYLNGVNNEFERIEKILSNNHKQNLVENAKKQIGIISELFKSISDIAVGSPQYSIENIMKQVNPPENKEQEEANK